MRAVYLNAGAADLYAETGDPELLAALHRLWASMTGRKLYVSGGIGARHEGEAFGADYELPSRTAYAETCAAIVAPDGLGTIAISWPVADSSAVSSPRWSVAQPFTRMMS